MSLVLSFFMVCLPGNYQEMIQADCSQNMTIMRLHMEILMSLLLVMPVKIICYQKSVT